MSLRQLRRLGGAGLVVAAVLVWARDPTWLDQAADTLPLASGIPLAWWLGGPWTPREALPRKWPTSAIIMAALVFAGGWILSSLTLLALAWTIFAWIWAQAFYQARRERRRLLVILMLSFPWLVLEWPQPGWWLRMSSAAVSEGLFHLLRMPVVREGTQLVVTGIPVNIEPACSGWNLLQISLFVGVVIGVHEIAPRGRFPLFLCLLPLLAWTANLMRIVVLSGVALTFEVAVADGLWHSLTGFLAIMVVVIAARVMGHLIAPSSSAITRTIPSPR